MNHSSGMSVFRLVVAAVVGVTAWFVVATAINLAFRANWPGYAAGEPGFAFTTPMLVARLGLGVLCSVAAGLVAAAIARRPEHGVTALCALLLILFVPQHVQLGSRFPIWYHATFLASLLVAPWLGRRMLGARPSGPNVPTVRAVAARPF